MAYQIQGEVIPVLQVELGPVPVYFVQHNILWKDPQVQINQKTLSSEYKRKLGKKTLIMTEAKGPGNIAFSFGHTGTIVPVFLKAYESIDVKEHQFVAATDNVEFSCVKMQKVSELFLEGGGTFIDTFSCRQGEGLVWLQGLGDVSEINLSEGQQIDVKAENWVYKNKSVKMESIFQDFSSGFLPGDANQLMLNRFIGPGKVGMQTSSLLSGN